MDQLVDLDVTIVVVAYRRPNQLAVLLGHLRGLNVIVVNVTDDESVALTASAAGVTILSLKENVGFAAAVNHAMAYVETEYVLFANDDVVLEVGAVCSLCASLEGVDVVAPVIVDANQRIDSAAFPLPSPLRLLVEWAVLPDEPVPLLAWLPIVKWLRPSLPVIVPAVAGTVVFTRTQLMREIPLPESYFLYWEDMEWCHRLHRSGRRVRLDPTIRVVHESGRGDVNSAKSRLMARNAVRCVRRTKGRGMAAAAWPVVILWNARLLGTALARRAGNRTIGARAAGLRSAVSAVTELR